ncbi:hypothetical protein ACSBR1_042335 [Camellia fascicularis]
MHVSVCKSGHRSSIQYSPVQRSLSVSPVRSRVQFSTSASEEIQSQTDQLFLASIEEMIRQLQQIVETMQRDAARQAEATTRQTEQQPQQVRASDSHPPPPPLRVPTPGETANVQENTDVPIGPVPPPIPPQMSKAPANPVDTPFEFEVDPTALKGVNSIPDIEDGYTDSAVTLPDRFKMPHIDHFDGSGDPMVHLRLFSDILHPMGLTRLQNLSLFGRTLSSIAAIWNAKLEDSVKRS